jgi:hypothetical protein
MYLTWAVILVTSMNTHPTMQCEGGGGAIKSTQAIWSFGCEWEEGGGGVREREREDWLRSRQARVKGGGGGAGKARGRRGRKCDEWRRSPEIAALRGGGLPSASLRPCVKAAFGPDVPTASSTSTFAIFSSSVTATFVDKAGSGISEEGGGRESGDDE